MSTTIKLPDNLINEAKRYASIYSRSTPKQIEYWANIGKIAEENPDLPYSFIKEIMISKAELADEQLTPFDLN